MPNVQISDVLLAISIIANIILGLLAFKSSQKNSIEKKYDKLEKEYTDLKTQLEIRDATYVKNGLTYYKQKDGTEIVICPKCFSKNPTTPIPLENLFHMKERWLCRTNDCGFIAVDSSMPETQIINDNPVIW